MEATRVDRWLWAVRLAPTRTAASDACRGGHVRVDGRPAKPATPVTMGSRVEARVRNRTHEVVVREVIGARVGAPRAVQCYLDVAPPPPPGERPAPVAVRERGAGRPTKRDRRRIDRLRSGP